MIHYQTSSNSSLAEDPGDPTEDCSHSTLPSPGELKKRVPLSRHARETVQRGRAELRQLLEGNDSDRLAVICGPCSVHDIDSTLQYAEHLRQLADRVCDRILLVMRVYLEKPRSVLGWKGLLYETPEEDPSSVSANPLLSLDNARHLLRGVNEIGLPCATEFLNPLLVPYIQDGVSYGAIGARTVESQIHREVCSGLAMPVGLKNGMDGRPQSAANAVRSVAAPHQYFGMSEQGQPALLSTRGNPYGHIILRGGSNGPNYDPETVSRAMAGMAASSLDRPLIVDCSHANSDKDPSRQAQVAHSVLDQYLSGQRGIAGLMLESHLLSGRQDVLPKQGIRYGQSITDACIGWEETESLVMEIHHRLATGATANHCPQVRDVSTNHWVGVASKLSR